ncbi:MAG: YdcF family protein [Clostridiales bacterium]|nr:YdcF family protein [Clostridiales bacterium]
MIFNKILTLSGAALLLYSILYIPMFPKNQGGYFLALIGAVLLLYSLLREKIISKCNKGILKYIRLVLTAGFCFMLITLLAFCLSIAAISSNLSANNTDAVIVLGAGLNGTQVSTVLAKRLDKAVEFYHENPHVMIVVAGGQGEDQIVSEAFAMRKYLVARGVNEDNILLEDRSTSTRENFAFSKIVLDEFFGDRPYTTAYITNDFHCRRAGRFAEMAGLDTYFIPARTPLFAFPAYLAREYLAYVYLMLFGG